MKKKILKLLFIMSALVLVSCGESNNDEHANAGLQDSTTSVPDSSAEQTVFYNLPSPLETFTILKISGAAFDKSLLNPVDKISKYTTNAAKAINLGIYSTDLSMSFMYKQNQEVNLYLKNVSALSNSLQIDGSYGQFVFKRMQANENNLDSLMQIVSEASVNTDIYLKENQRNSAVVLIAAGAWIESLHIIANIANKTQKEDVIALVADQRVAISPLVNMLEQHQSDADVAVIIEDMKSLASIYALLEAKEIATATASVEKGIPNVGNNKSYSLSKDQLKSILKKTEAIRNKFTN